MLKIINIILISAFMFFAALPITSPDNVHAESKKSASAKKRSAARLIKKLLKSNNLTEAQKEEAYALAAARCNAGPKANHTCGDGKGTSITITKAEDCNKCKQGTGTTSCELCCDDLAGSNQDICDMNC